ncbi:MAG TPA: lytic transglycosylase domain-containing protein [Xanthobacteraceae bacterium]|jgi:hypothetical protein|nr:lytic transglycosylase domain-containing protein [Xanthobacteraceae bacterium]
MRVRKDPLADARMKFSNPIAAFIVLLFVTAGFAQETPPRGSATGESICLMVEAAALANGLPAEFFARVIWQESNFKPETVGPVTRNGDRAQGIAQFMPATAAERRLLDPFDPIQALPKSAEFLRELLTRFGNLGLAAAAYNAGPKRIQDWLDKRGAVPRETRNYVQAITGRPIDDWAAAGRDSARHQFERSLPTCREMTATLRQKPNPFIEQLQKRVETVAARPWGVQLSAGFSRSGVLAAYANLERRYRNLLADRDPTILARRFLSRGSHAFYQVRVGEPTRESANKLCSDLRKAGGPCMVLRNPLRSG